MKRNIHSIIFIFGLLTIFSISFTSISKNDHQTTCPPPDCTAGKNVDRDFFAQVVQGLNDVPYSDYAVEILMTWAPYENTNACWNPLATTWKMEVVCDFNSVGVQHYQDKDQGVRATANTLNLQYYNTIRSLLRHEVFDRDGLITALGTWGTCQGAGCNALLGDWQELWDDLNTSSVDDSNSIVELPRSWWEELTDNVQHQIDNLWVNVRYKIEQGFRQWIIEPLKEMFLQWEQQCLGSSLLILFPVVTLVIFQRIRRTGGRR